MHLHGLRSSFPVHVLECFHIGISAVWQNGNETGIFDEFTGIRIDNMGGLAAQST